MKRKEYKIVIQAPAEKVYNTMLGLDDIKNYEDWTKEFNPTSTYEGRWEKDSKMYFVGTDEKGNKGGMVSKIEDIDVSRFVSIQHYGILKDGEEITEGPDVEKWAGGYENYHFHEENGTTTVTVAVDVVEDYMDYFNNTYPKALERLKKLCEA